MAELWHMVLQAWGWIAARWHWTLLGGIVLTFPAWGPRVLKLATAWWEAKEAKARARTATAEREIAESNLAEQRRQENTRTEERESDSRVRALAKDDTRMHRLGATEEWLTVSAMELGISTDDLRASVRRLKQKGLFPWHTDFYLGE